MKIKVSIVIDAEGVAITPSILRYAEVFARRNSIEIPKDAVWHTSPEQLCLYKHSCIACQTMGLDTYTFTDTMGGRDVNKDLVMKSKSTIQLMSHDLKITYLEIINLVVPRF